jgi:hypothetical protein
MFGLLNFEATCMSTLRRPRPNLLLILIAAVLLLLAVGMFIAFFEQLPIEGTSLGIDWITLYRSMAGGQARYEPGFINPPWTALMVAPLGLLSMRASWGLLALLTVAVEVASVPRVTPRWRTYAGILLLIVSIPTLRHLADGNFEGLVIAGILLSLWAYRRQHVLGLVAGVLLATSKPQVGGLFVLALGVCVLQRWPRRQSMQAAAAVLLIVVGTLAWMGDDWLRTIRLTPDFGSLMDVSLRAAFNRAGIPAVFYLAALGLILAATTWIVWRSVRTFSREKAGMLTAAALLVAPYSAGNSALTVMAVGIIPLFQKRPRLGLALILLLNTTIFIGRDFSAYYTTALLLLLWAVQAWWVWRSEIRLTSAGSYPTAAA